MILENEMLKVLWNIKHERTTYTCEIAIYIFILKKASTSYKIKVFFLKEWMKQSWRWKKIYSTIKYNERHTKLIEKWGV